MSDTRPQIDWHPHSPAAKPERGLRDDPGRIVLLAACAGMIISAFPPWAEGIHPAGFPISYSPQEYLAEGFVIFLLAIILAVLAWGHWLVESTSRTVQLLPVVIAVIAAAMWIGADRVSTLLIEQWTDGGGSGAHTIWRLVSAASIVTILVGTVLLEASRPAEMKAQTRGLIAEWRPSRVGFSAGLLAAALGIGFAIVGAVITLAVVGGNGAIFAVFVSLFGMAAGISVGLGISRWIRGADQPGGREGMESTTGRVEISRVERRH